MNINLTLIGQMISFGLFVWFCMKYIWPPIVTALDERKERISKGLAAVEDAEHKLAKAELKSADLAKGAKQKSSEIIASAEKHASDIIEKAKVDAITEGKRQLEAAKANIEQEGLKLKEELRENVSALVLAAASQIVKKEIDADKHSQLINDFAKQL